MDWASAAEAAHEKNRTRQTLQSDIVTSFSLHVVFIRRSSDAAAAVQSYSGAYSKSTLAPARSAPQPKKRILENCQFSAVKVGHKKKETAEHHVRQRMTQQSTFQALKGLLVLRHTHTHTHFRRMKRVVLVVHQEKKEKERILLNGGHKKTQADLLDYRCCCCNDKPNA